MKILIDMNLPPRWVQFFINAGIESVHWATVGAFNAKDSEIMAWARENDYVVFTHDLDFSALLAATAAAGPSVIQVRTQNVLPEFVGTLVMRVIKQFDEELRNGVLISIDEQRSRARILPF